jgi:hypothetical protein
MCVVTPSPTVVEVGVEVDVLELDYEVVIVVVVTEGVVVAFPLEIMFQNFAYPD